MQGLLYSSRVLRSRVRPAGREQRVGARSVSQCKVRVVTRSSLLPQTFPPREVVLPHAWSPT